MISERTGKDSRKFELVEEPENYLSDLNTYIPRLMEFLWNDPKIVATVIENSKGDDLKEQIAPFFANNFYENILSTYYIEDNLMYVLTLLLQNEINGLHDINQSDDFLNNTPCGIILEELKRKGDIQAYFKDIIFNDVQKLEVNYSSVAFKFKIDKLEEDFKTKNSKELKGKKYSKTDEQYLRYRKGSSMEIRGSLDESFANVFEYCNKNNKNQSSLDKFNEKYSPDLNKTALQALIEENKDKKIIIDYLNPKLNEVENSQDIFSNKIFFNKLFQNDLSKELLFQYHNYFNVIISFIDSILDKIINNFHLLPYSVKCLCKIISILITKKFPTISDLEKNVYIARFFFGKLLIPFLKNPGVEAFINNFIISGNTLSNLSIICQIIAKFSSGKFYTSNIKCEFTPFNWFFIEKIEKLFNICEHITKARLPSFIEKFINNELPDDYKYEYFKENPDEVISHNSICFNLDQIKAIISSFKNCESQLFANNNNSVLKKTLDKLSSKNSLKLINNLLSKERKEQPETVKPTKRDKFPVKVEVEGPKVHYILLKNLVKNEEYTKLFDIKQETANFSIEEIKSTPNEETEIQNNIIKVKNFFCSLLCNYNKLVKTDFDEGTTQDTEKILKELNYFMKSSNFVVDGSIPSEWYVKSLLEYLKKIPEDLTKNDCEKLYNEIEEDVNKSIKELDFEALSVIMGKLKYARRFKYYYEESKTLLNDIKLNEETKSIIENEFIPFEIKFYLNGESENGEFKLSSSSFKEKDRDNFDKIKDYEKSKKVRLCLTIDEFTKKFPNLVKYQEFQDADIFEIQKKFDFPLKLNQYFENVKISLYKKNSQRESKSIHEKIYDYVMTKIYDKIYPNEPYGSDTKIFQNSVRISWAEPKHFIKSKKQLVFGSFLTDVLKFFKLIDTEKSPRKKILNMNEIFNSIGFLLKFNGVGAEAGVDDQLPILTFSFVKAQPLRMFSNAQFMELYIGDKINKNDGSQLTQLLSSCDFIANIKYSSLIGVTSEEFVKKCNEATNNY